MISPSNIKFYFHPTFAVSPVVLNVQHLPRVLLVHALPDPVDGLAAAAGREDVAEGAAAPQRVGREVELRVGLEAVVEVVGDGGQVVGAEVAGRKNRNG